MTAPTRAGRREWIGLAVLALPVLLLSLDLSVLYLALPQLSADLGPSASQLLWITDIYGFMLAGFLLTMGTLGDRIGRRRLLLIGAAAFGVASILAAFSPTPEALIATRALLGVAGATLMPSTLSLIAAIFRDPAERSLAIGVWMTCFMVGTVIGPLVGGVMLEFFWWGSVFLLAVPVMVLLLVTGPKLLPEVRDAGAGRLDLGSVALVLLTLLPVVYAVKDVASSGPTVVAAVLVVVGLGAGVLFVRRQRRLDSPLVDVGLFSRRAFGATLAIMLLGGTAVGGIYLFFTQYLQLVEGLSPLGAGVWSLAPAAALSVSSLSAPALAQRLGPGYVIAAGFAVALVGFVVLAMVAPGDGPLIAVAGMSIVYFGFGPGAVLGTDLVIGAAPEESAGAASAMSETGAELGVALGVAVLGSVGTAVYQARMLGAGVSGPVAEGLSGPSVPGLPPEVLATARESFTGALGIAATICALTVAALAVVSALVLGRRTASTGEATSSGSGDLAVGEAAAR